MPATKDIPGVAERLLERDNEALYEALDQLVRAYQFRDRQRTCYYDLSVNECYALQTLLRHDGMTQNDLAAQLLLDKSTTSRLVARMEASGHIARTPDPDDGRFQRLGATASGKKRHAKIRRDLLNRQLDLISDLPDRSRRAAVVVLQRLAESATRHFDGRGAATEGR